MNETMNVPVVNVSGRKIEAGELVSWGDVAPASGRELPILFGPPMVLSLRAKIKTQTRRIVKPQPAYPESFAECRQECDGKEVRWFMPGASEAFTIWTPRYQVGDVLWVREAYRLSLFWDGLPAGQVPSDAPVRYGADGCNSTTTPSDFVATWGRYRHARFMPRWASRITLLVEAVRCERLQAITEDDAKAEGIREPDPAHGHWCDPKRGRLGHWSYRKPYSQLWNTINGPGAWEQNSFVWAYTFREVPCAKS